MRRLTTAIGCACLTLTALSAGCASNAQHATTKATPATIAAFDHIKALGGEWEMTDEKGVRSVASVFAVTSAGSAVREVMFPGSAHEMTNMYHMDGDALVATHYCAAGNQPRMRCTVIGSNQKYAFVFTDITNLPDPNADHMADLTLTIHDANHITEAWDSYENGAKTTHVVLELTRKR